MKRTLLLMLAVLTLAASGAAAQEKSLFRVYLDERSTENFLEAWKSYEAMRADTVNYNAAIVLAYLALIELEKNLETLEENKEDLSARNLFQYGNILLELERYEESIALYEMLNEKTPKWSCPWRHKGEAYWEMKKYEEAEKALLKSIETRETHYDAYVWLARVYRDMERYEEGLATLEKGLTYYGKDIEDPEEEVSNVDVGFLRLDLLGKCGMTEEYEKQHEKMKKVAPDDERLK